jgi:hypothetical protein
MIKVVHKKSGLNWGLQDGHSKKGKGYAEAYIPVTAELIDSHPKVFPCIPDVRMTTTGKVTRKFDPVQVEWDDGTVMEMIFSGTGVERPTKDERNLGDPYKTYPKQFTSGADTDGGGAELGKYLRQRMNVSARHIITIDDLKSFPMVIWTPTSTYRMIFEDALNNIGEHIKNFDIMLETDSITSIKTLVSSDVALSIFPQKMGLNRSKYICIPIEGLNMKRDINMIYRRDYTNVNTIKEFI